MLAQDSECNIRMLNFFLVPADVRDVKARDVMIGDLL